MPSFFLFSGQFGDEKQSNTHNLAAEALYLLGFSINSCFFKAGLASPIPV